MSKLINYNGHFCESEYEYAFIGFLEQEEWRYTLGNKIKRTNKTDVLVEEDFKEFIANTNDDLTGEEIDRLFDMVRLVGAETDFATLHKLYGWMVNGVQFVPQNGQARMVSLIDFDPKHTERTFSGR